MHTEISDEEIKVLLEKRLRRSLNPAIWAHIVAKRYTKDFRDDLEHGLSERKALDALAKTYKEFEQLVRDASTSASPASPGKKEKKVYQSPPSYRTRLQWIADSMRAAQHPLVKRFREKYLHNALLSPEEVESWIEARQEEERGSSGPLYTITLPLGHRFVRVQENGSIHYEIEPPLTPEEFSSIKLWGPSRWETLTYVSLSDYTEHSVPVSPGGALDALRMAADAISSECRWNKAEATMFVLTGEMDSVRTIRITTISEFLPEPEVTCVTIALSPEVSPEHLKRFYGKVRREMIFKGGHRIRTLNEKAFNMAKFVMTNPQLDTWQKRFDEWNRQFPQWEYNSLLAMQQAYSRISQALHLPTATQIAELVKVPGDPDSGL